MIRKFLTLVTLPSFLVGLLFIAIGMLFIAVDSAAQSKLGANTD